MLPEKPSAKKICSAAGCDKKSVGRGMCGTHYAAWRRGGGVTREPIVKPTICIVDECSKKVLARGWCSFHYHRWNSYGDPNREPEVKETRFCSIDGCNEKHYGNDLCNLHYQRLRFNGDPNKVQRIRNDDELRFDSFVDKSESCWNWTGYRNKGGYGRLNIGQNHILAHRYSYERQYGPIPEGFMVDHMCHNPSCVNPSHLRLATGKQNQENLSGPRVDNRLGVRGVSMTRSGKYKAQVGHNGEKIDVGIFASLEEADSAVRAKRNELFTHNILDRKTA